MRNAIDLIEKGAGPLTVPSRGTLLNWRARADLYNRLVSASGLPWGENSRPSWLTLRRMKGSFGMLMSSERSRLPVEEIEARGALDERLSCVLISVF
jgi:hypothetical protein